MDTHRNDEYPSGIAQGSYASGYPSYPNQQPYHPNQQPHGGFYGQPVPVPPVSAYTGSATASLVLGIVGLVFCWVPLLGLVLNGLALVFAAVALSKRTTSRGSAVAGLTMGSIGLLIQLIFLVVAIVSASHS
jgi:hypothetical protein